MAEDDEGDECRVQVMIEALQRELACVKVRFVCWCPPNALRYIISERLGYYYAPIGTKSTIFD